MITRLRLAPSASSRSATRNFGHGFLKITDDDVANICCAVADYINNVEEALARTDVESRREMLRCIVDRIIVDRPGNLTTVYIRQIPDLSGVENFLLNNLDNKFQFVYHYTYY